MRAGTLPPEGALANRNQKNPGLRVQACLPGKDLGGFCRILLEKAGVRGL
jgi:hypothetical protein